ncbi:hypothetical protein RJ639_038962 [Escallonia herrerae]|uniref:Uncharacterized protein n=1 Tax=Escallonia herrerae TaxID=1293975 RepID=A0AA89B5J7_9ASTE|nr:hypothetical protein RJ639_038962 [Escallonia herrerae]
MPISFTDLRETYYLYNVIFFDDEISTVVTNGSEHAGRWIQEIETIHRCCLHRLIVCLDIEWRLTSAVAPTTQSPPYCSASAAAASSSKSSMKLASLCLYTFVGVGIERDVVQLSFDYEFDVIVTMVDLSRLAAEKWGPRHGVASQPRHGVASQLRQLPQSSHHLQLCICCLFLQIIHQISFSLSLCEFVDKPNYTFVGLGVEKDVDQLSTNDRFDITANVVLDGLAA